MSLHGMKGHLQKYVDLWKPHKEEVLYLMKNAPFAWNTESLSDNEGNTITFNSKTVTIVSNNEDDVVNIPNLTFKKLLNNDDDTEKKN